MAFGWFVFHASSELSNFCGISAGETTQRSLIRTITSFLLHMLKHRTARRLSDTKVPAAFIFQTPRIRVSHGNSSFAVSPGRFASIRRI